MLEIVREIAADHGLSVEDSRLAVERAAGRVLQSVLRIDAYARFNDDSLSFYRFCPDRGEVPIRADHIRKKVVRRLRHEIGRLLASEEVAQDWSGVQWLVGSIVNGKIRGISPAGLLVTVALPSGEKFTALCPGHQLSVKDRPKYGAKWKFYVSRVSIKPGNPSRVEMVLSRTSKEFVVALLRERILFFQDELPRIRAVKRIPGNFTMIESSEQLDRTVVGLLAQELGEKIVFLGVRRGSRG